MKAPILAAVATLMLGGAALANEPETYAFVLKPGTNKCTVEYPRSDGTTLYLLLTKDQKFNAGVYRPEWESLVEGKNTDSESHPVTLEFKDGGQVVGKTKAKWGGYTNGFNQGVWSAWDVGSGSDGAMALLEKSTAIAVAFEGKPLASFDMKQKGFAFHLLKNCVNNP